MGFRPGIALISLLASLGLANLGLANLGLASLGLAGPGVLALFPSPALATTTERVVVNRYTGLAIEGFDPVAYFVDARPLIGREAYEAS